MDIATSKQVYLVGAGPGDPELLTLKAQRLIHRADDLVVDALVPQTIYAGCKARLIYVGKRAGRPHISQEKIGQILVELAQAGRIVVRLKGGDPGLFGRLAEEIEVLQQAHINFEVVPGVSSAFAAAACAAIPLTARSVADRVTFITGHRQVDAEPVFNLPVYHAEQTLVVFMATNHLTEIVTQALARRYPEDLPALVISRATQTGEKQIKAPLCNIHLKCIKQGIESPATLILGHVAALAQDIACEYDERLTLQLHC